MPAAKHIGGREPRLLFDHAQLSERTHGSGGRRALGECQAALALTLDWVTQRKAFGAPLWEKQAIRQRLAMLAARVESARQFTYHCAWMDGLGRDCVKEVSMVKALCGELVNDDDV